MPTTPAATTTRAREEAIVSALRSTGVSRFIPCIICQHAVADAYLAGRELAIRETTVCSRSASRRSSAAIAEERVEKGAIDD
jgi:hypothetical protein